MLLLRKQFVSAFLLFTILNLSGCNGLSETNALKPTLRAVELNWNDFYKLPVGPLGLEPTPKLLSLANKAVRLHGYMVQEEEPQTGVFLLTPMPVSLAEQEDGPADDLPATTVFVHMPEADKQQAMKFRAGLWELEGTLVLGNQEEPGGRVSYARLMLD